MVKSGDYAVSVCGDPPLDYTAGSSLAPAAEERARAYVALVDAAKRVRNAALAGLPGVEGAVASLKAYVERELPKALEELKSLASSLGLSVELPSDFSSPVNVVRAGDGECSKCSVKVLQSLDNAVAYAINSAFGIQHAMVVWPPSFAPGASALGVLAIYVLALRRAAELEDAESPALKVRTVLKPTGAGRPRASADALQGLKSVMTALDVAKSALETRRRSLEKRRGRP